MAPCKINSATRENSADEDLKPATVFRPCFKLIYAVLGITCNSTRSKLNNIFRFLVILRMITVIAISSHNNFGRKIRLIEFLVDSGVDFYPLVEFVYLSIALTRLNREFETFSDRLAIKITHLSSVIECVRQQNARLIIYIAVTFMFCLGDIFSMIHVPRNWLVRHTFPVPTSLGSLTETIIGYLIALFECMIKNYIPLSASLYLCYYKLLLSIKEKVLHNISSSTTHKSIYEQLRELDCFVDTFESVLSILPLNWLSYNVGPGLCYIQSITYYGDEEMIPLQITIFVALTCINFIFIIVILYVINKWQEQFDEKVNSFSWAIEENLPSLTNFRLIDRVEKIMKRRATVWHTFPIERSLILSYIGSALTFSVFFAKM